MKSSQVSSRLSSRMSSRVSSRIKALKRNCINIHMNQNGSLIEPDSKTYLNYSNRRISFNPMAMANFIPPKKEPS